MRSLLICYKVILQLTRSIKARQCNPKSLNYFQEAAALQVFADNGLDTSVFDIIPQGADFDCTYLPPPGVTSCSEGL